VDELASSGQLESCLAWLIRVHVQQLILGSHKVPLHLQHVQMLASAMLGVARPQVLAGLWGGLPSWQGMWASSLTRVSW
jgi:hypothetical protein